MNKTYQKIFNIPKKQNGLIPNIEIVWDIDLNSELLGKIHGMKDSPYEGGIFEVSIDIFNS